MHGLLTLGSSVFITVTQLMAIAPALFVGHSLCYWPLQWATSAVTPATWDLTLPVNTTFVWAFFVIDQLL